MSIEFWGINGAAGIRFPQSLDGWVLMVAYVAVILAFLMGLRRQRSLKDLSLAKSWPWVLLLAALSPLTMGLLQIQFPADRLVGSSHVPLLAAIPWLVAGGMLGGWQALLVAIAAGLFRAIWDTGSAITVLHVVLQASFVVWLMKRDYDDWLGSLLRHPLLSALLGAMLFGFLQTVESVLGSPRGLFQAVDVALAAMGMTILARLLELFLAGVLVEVLRLTFPQLWLPPRWLSAAPYNRSLAGRMLTVLAALGLVAGSLLLTGDWLLARSSARELTERDMQQTAVQIGSGIPIFVQTGRSLLDRLETELAVSGEDPESVRIQLDSGLRLVPYFNRLVVFDALGQTVAQAPDMAFESDSSMESDVQAYLPAALQGIPQEFVLAPLAPGDAARLVFLKPIINPVDRSIAGAIAGWTDLASNPFLLPTIKRLEQVSPGSAFLVDESGRIVIHADLDKILEPVSLAYLDQFILTSTEDGVRNLQYSEGIQGSPWHVIVVKPQSVVSSLATQMLLRSFFVIAAIGSLALGIVYAISRSLTRPLRMMARAVESIARGNLENEISIGGQDEIGRLSVSIEHMRKSLRARLDEMDLLLTVSQRVASSLDLTQILPPVLDGVRDLTHADMVRLVLTPDDPGLSSNPRSFQTGEDPGSWHTLDAQLLQLCLERGQFVLENPARARAVLDLRSLEAPLEALAAVPVMIEESVGAVLWTGHQAPHVFSANEMNLLSILAGQLGVALENASLYAQAEEERLRMATILAETPDAVLVTDELGRVSLANPAAAMLLDVPPEQVHGQPVDQVVQIPALVASLSEENADRGTFEFELEDGRILFASIADIEGRHAGRVAVLRDITHYKKLDSMKSDFVATVSHDLRTPLRMMRGYAKMLSMVGAMSDQQRSYLDKILETESQMSRLVDGLLDLGRIESGLGLHLETLSVKEIVQDVVRSYHPRAANRQITLQADIEDGMLPLDADATLLRQALANLVENAIQFSPRGGQVTVRVSQGQGQQLIQVQDSGVGIAPMDQARIFERFYQTGREKPRDGGSSGLGLAIVKSIVDQHKGQVRVDSRLGSGSTFTIELPIRADDALDSP